MVALNPDLNITALLTGLHLFPKQILRILNLCQRVTESGKFWQSSDEDFNILIYKAFNISKISESKNKTLACGQYIFKTFVRYANTTQCLFCSLNHYIAISWHIPS